MGTRPAWGPGHTGLSVCQVLPWPRDLLAPMGSGSPSTESLRPQKLHSGGRSRPGPSPRAPYHNLPVVPKVWPWSVWAGLDMCLPGQGWT